MEKQVLLDKLSEFLMVEQCGAQLYEVVAARAPTPEIRSKYEEFGAETNHHREVLTQLIAKLGGDPNYVSPMARVAQVRGEEMLCLALRCDALTPLEVACMDIESVALAETKDHADWSFLAKLLPQVQDATVQQALQAAVDEVEDQEDEHLAWAMETMDAMAMQILMQGPAPTPMRWQEAWAGPHFLPEEHPAPMEERDGLLEGAKMPAWIDSTVSRAVAAAAGGAKAGRS